MHSDHDAGRRKIELCESLDRFGPPLWDSILGWTAWQVIVAILWRSWLIRLVCVRGTMALAAAGFFERRLFANLAVRWSFAPRKQITHTYSLREKHGEGEHENDETPHHVNKIGTKATRFQR